MEERNGPALPAAAHAAPVEGLNPRLMMQVWLPFACGYFLSYVYRTVNAVISHDLVRDIGLDSSELGLLTSAYFLAFGAFQPPLGVLLDRFGPRRVNGALLVVAAMGAAAFAVADTVAGLTLARALIGLGVSACLMASIKAFVQWFPLPWLASLNGWLLAAGGLGAMAATVPVEAALGFTDWRGIFLGVSAATFAAAALILLVVPEHADPGRRESLRELLAGILTVFRDALFWRLSMLLVFVQGGFLSIQGLWAAPWLRDIAGMDRAEIANMLLAMAFATTLGFASLGTIADRLARRGVDTLLIFNATAAISIAALALIVLGARTGIAAVWLAFSFCGTGSVLLYAVLSRNFPSALAGRVNTAANLLVFAGAFATQWGIGAVINLWPALGAGFSPEGYRAALGALLALQCIAFGLAVLRRR